jgi:hypothetical protein
LAPRGGREVAQQLPKQRVFGLIVGVVLPSEHRAIHREAIDAPLGHQDHDATAEDLRILVTEPGFLRYRMLGAPLALEGAVADQIEDPSAGGGKACKAWSANHHSRAFVHQ